MNKKQLVVFLTAVVLCLAGCGSTVTDTDTLSVKKDGSAVYTIVSDFPEAYYDLEELKEMAEAEVSAYGAGVQITEAAVEEEVLHFQYAFTSLTDYASFMETACYHGTVGQALSAGYKADTVLTSAKDGGSKKISNDALKDYQLFIWNEPVAVRVDGKVLYYSSNLTVKNKTDVAPNAEAAGPYYVIYK